MKVAPTVFKGIEFIRISELPLAQKLNFEATFNKVLLIKILIDGKIIHDCIQWKDYQLWLSEISTNKN